MLRNLVEDTTRHDVAAREVRVRILTHTGAPEIHVDNLGPRRTPGVRVRVPERFHREPGSRAPGSGLGPSVARRIAQLYTAIRSLQGFDVASGVHAAAARGRPDRPYSRECRGSRDDRR